MRRAASRLHWQGIGVLAVLALALGIVAPLLLYGNAKADAPVFNASAEVMSVSPDTTGANGEIHNLFEVDKEPWPSLHYDVQVSFQPQEWGIAKGEDVPIGAFVGTLDAVSKTGMFDNPCGQMTLTPHFDLMNCTVDDSEGTVDYAGQFVNRQTLADGCTQWPAFLTTLFPGMTPIARMGDYIKYLEAVDISMNFLIFAPGTQLPARFNTPAFPADRGYVAISILNDPTGPLVVDKVTDMCPPAESNTHYWGLTKDNPRTTGTDESGNVWRTNPCAPGTYAFWDYTASIRDADGDNLDNALDTCPHIACTNIAQCDPTVAGMGGGDADVDHLDDACDNNPSVPEYDHDGDQYKNFQDNCPLIYNPDQLDTDLDRIGDVCDTTDWNGDGTPDNTVLGPTASGQRVEMWFPTDIEITGDDVCPPTDWDGDGVLDEVDNCPTVYNPDQTDTDEDGVGDVCDICPYDPDNDIDGDGVCGDVDNCPDVPNESQTNSDADSYGNACDNCPTTTNEDQADSDGDGVGDVCEDSDGDGFLDDEDNCPTVYNPDQTDTDSDGFGDACDPDDDNDGVLDEDDVWCRTRAEDFDGYQDGDGCPDTDNDMDGICDPGLTSYACSGSDGCPNVAEDYDASRDTDGCPDPDNDGDFFPDHSDSCPGTDGSTGDDGISCTNDPNEVNTCEDYDGIMDTDGCHDSPGDDYDGDSMGRVNQQGFPLFWDEVEVYLGTDPTDACPDGLTDDAWPLDLDKNKTINVTGDVLNYRGRISATGGPPPSPNWRQRLDLNKDNFITVAGDVLMFRGEISKTCT